MESPQSEKRRSGVVTLVGRSNAGKSTLLNALVGFKIAPVSPRAQMTRLPVHGIYEDGRGQIVFVDTPGLFAKVPDALTRTLNKKVEESIKHIDALVYVADPHREVGPEERRLLALVRSIPKKIIAINKTDIPRPPFLPDYEAIGEEEFSAIVHISAKTHAHLKTLLEKIFSLLPEQDPLYSEEEKQMDSHAFKTWIAEMIREKIFNTLSKEVPYAMHVEVHETPVRVFFNDTATTEIYTRDDRLRPIIIGKGGRRLKEIGMQARKELELLLNKKIYLSLEVEHDPHWAERALR